LSPNWTWPRCPTTGALEAAVRAAIDSDPAAVTDYRAGKVSAINKLLGQVMKTTGRTANPAVAKSLLEKHLSN